MITIKNVTKKYGERIVLDIEDYSFEDGKIYALLGANGSGKSTLLKIIGGIIKSDSGEVGGIDTAKIGYSPQTSYGYNMSVLNNVLLPCHNKRESVSRAKALLAALNIEELSNKNASALSGGETEKLALARLLIANHDILLLDEPTAAMDANAVAGAETIILKYLNDNKATLLFATHSIEQAKRLSHKLIYIENGKIIRTQDNQGAK